MSEFKKRIKQVKYFSYWLATETLQKCKLISDKQKEGLIDEFLEDLDTLIGPNSVHFRVIDLKNKWKAKKNED